MYKKLIFFIIIIFVFCFWGCKNQKPNEKTQNQEIKINNENIITVATFNLKFFGDLSKENDSVYGKFGENIRKGSLELISEFYKLVGDADIIAFQEIENEIALNNLVESFNTLSKGEKIFKGYISDNPRSCQDLALVWNEKKFDFSWKGYKFPRDYSIIEKGSQRNSYFARAPIYNIFQKNGIKFMTVVVHLKAKGRGDADNIKREKESARLLDWIEYQKKEHSLENVVLIGDFNDVYTEDLLKTDLDPLIKHEMKSELFFLTKNLDSKKVFTNFGIFNDTEYKEIIDHIIITKNLKENYVENSISVRPHNSDRISDHNPVSAKFNFKMSIDKNENNKTE